MKRSKPLLAWLAGTLFVIVLALVFALRPRTRVVNEADAPKPNRQQQSPINLTRNM